MSAARPPEGAHTVAEGAGIPSIAARPPEGAHTAAEGAGIPSIAARPPEGARTAAEGAGTPVNAIDLLAERANKTCADGHFDGAHGAAVPSPCIAVCRMSPERGHCEGCFRTLDEIRLWSSADGPLRRRIWQQLLGRAGIALPALVSRHGSDVVGCAQPSERSARRSAQPIPSVLASDATPRCASMASADRQMIGDATLETPP
ncbi:DUF1289 domain-containing protein [Verminephrobacter eiseniae]|uniref:DUF1289 domain-containing protein n=1 Tax=Verminephrobacter eiseniae TaxID=364317 RepID=UPI0038B3ED3B